MDAKNLFGNHWTVEDYFALEANSSERYEYHNGYIIGMSGGTVAHNIICGNIYSYLRAAAIQKGCNAFIENMQLKLSSHRYYYPDVLVTCEPLENNRLTVHAPCFVAEVLSESTEKKDLTSKLTTYMNSSSIQTILYVEQTKQLVYVWQKTSEGWEIKELTEGSIHIPCIDTHLALEQIYELVNLDQ